MKFLQELLNNADFLSEKIVVDSKFGPKTTKAVREVQKFFNLKQDEKVGPKTWFALLEYHKTKASYAIPASFQGQTVSQVSLPDNGKKYIALTFDDGPHPRNTEPILRILKKHNIPATFFVTGDLVPQNQEIVSQINNDGHIIGNHTYTHNSKNLTPKQEIDQAEETIQKITGVRPTLFRPPHGITNNGLVDYAKQKHMTPVLWSVDPKDWKDSNTQQNIIAEVTQQAKNGGIVLLHDGGNDGHKTAAALPAIIQNLQFQGYEFVTVPELLRINRT